MDIEQFCWHSNVVIMDSFSSSTTALPFDMRGENIVTVNSSISIVRQSMLIFSLVVSSGMQL